MVDDRNRYYEFPYGSDQRDPGYGRDYGSGRDYSYSSAREYQAAGELGREGRNFRGGGTGYGGYGYGRSGYGDGDYRGGGGASWRGSYASDGHRFTDVDRDDDRDWGRDWNRSRDMRRGDHRRASPPPRAPQGYDYDDRGFFARAGDEVRSWFGDEEAERRREADQRHDERMGGYGREGYGRDNDYHAWRRSQIDALDRDYDEYRRENASRFASEFGTWRTNRQSQRQLLDSVAEHMDVVGSDGEHVGTVDKVRGDRVILTKGDSDAGGRHHSFPSSWIATVDTRVTLTKAADDAKRHWRDEERSGAFFGSTEDEGRASGRDHDGKVNLNKSFSGTY